MQSRHSVGGYLAGLGVAGALFLAASPASAAMAPSGLSHSSNPDVQLAWCAAGLHIGPLGACLAGGPGPYYGRPGPYYGRPGWRGPRRCWINNWGRRVCNW